VSNVKKLDRTNDEQNSVFLKRFESYMHKDVIPLKI